MTCINQNPSNRSHRGRIKGRQRLLLVNPVVGGRGVLVETLREPEGDLLLGVLDGVRSVAYNKIVDCQCLPRERSLTSIILTDVSADLQSEGTPDGTGVGLEGVGGTEHDTAGPISEKHRCQSESGERKRCEEKTHLTASRPSQTIPTTGPEFM
jgi:hypothetical protein